MGVTDVAQVPGRVFALMGDRVVIVQHHGAVQALAVTDDWPDGAKSVLGNRFASRDTAGELRAIADFLDGLPWLDHGSVGPAAPRAVRAVPA